MRKQLLAALAAFPLVAGAADLAPGTYELAGTSLLDLGTGSTHSSTSGMSTTGDHTVATVGATGLVYGLPNLGVGVTASFGYQKTTWDGSSSTFRTYAAGPVLSYQVPLADHVALFGRASGTLNRSTWVGRGARGDDLTTSGYGFGLQAGVKYFPVEAVSLDAGLGWSWTRVSSPTSIQVSPGLDVPITFTTTTRNLGLAAGVSVYFGGGR